MAILPRMNSRCSRAKWWLSLLVMAALAAGGTTIHTASARQQALSAPIPHTTTVTIVIDPGHDRYANLRTEPIGPGSSIYKIKDGGGTSGVVTGQREATVNLRIGLRLRRLLRDAGGIRVAMTRTTTCCVSMGNIARARIANQAGAALFLRIHADGSTDHSVAGISTLYPATHIGWTDDIDGRSLKAAKAIQPRLVRALGWPNRGLSRRGDLTGFNWSNVPAVLVEVGFLTNPAEDRQLATSFTLNKAAWGLRHGVIAYLKAQGLRP
jgi:N-acetylmuramoyl-L-alanine amidase